MNNKEILKIAKPGSIIFFKKMKFVDECIRFGQSIKIGKASEWSHCAIKTFDDTLLESDFYFKGPAVFNGAIESRLGKYYKAGKVANIACVECILDQKTLRAVIANGRQLIQKKVKYAVAGLAGTLFNILKWRFSFGRTNKNKILQEQNVFFQQNTMYCAHFILSCFKEAGIDLLPHINPSVATVEDLYRTRWRQSFMIRKRIEY